MSDKVKYVLTSLLIGFAFGAVMIAGAYLMSWLLSLLFGGLQ